MRGDVKVIEQLNAGLRSELTAIVQYMVQAETCENWGYGKLAAATKARAIEEMHHAERLIERIIFLDGKPEVAVPLAPELGSNVPQQLENDLASESDAIREYNAAVALCREAGDAGSRELFEAILREEERHADFLEAQQYSLKEMGLANYLAQQLSV